MTDQEALAQMTKLYLREREKPLDLLTPTIDPERYSALEKLLVAVKGYADEDVLGDGVGWDDDYKTILRLLKGVLK